MRIFLEGGNRLVEGADYLVDKGDNTIVITSSGMDKISNVKYLKNAITRIIEEDTRRIKEEYGFPYK
jgi:hypothetical protein